jgi:hypothetical protein
MIHRRLTWLLPLALFACTPNSKSVGNGETNNADGSGDGSEGSSGSASASGSQSQSASESMTSAGPTGDPTTDDGTTTSGGTDPATSLTAADTDLTGSGGGPVCEIHVVVEEYAAGKMEPDDCGDLLLFDPVEDWEDARACALDHYSGGLAYTLVAEQQGIDSDVHVGFSGSQGEVYSSFRFVSDSNGLVPGTSIWGTPCDLAPQQDCVVGQGDLCLTCTNGDENMTICEIP